MTLSLRVSCCSNYLWRYVNKRRCLSLKINLEFKRLIYSSLTIDSSRVGGYAVIDSWGSLSKRFVLHSEIIQQRIFEIHSASVMR
jgi:hypothetical protein